MNKTVLAILVLFCTTLYPQLMNAEWRDPTRPPANATGQVIMSPALFMLTAIIIAHDRKIAVINNQNMRIGDNILGATVTAIQEDSVQLKGPRGKITLFLFGSHIKQSLQTRCKREWNLCEDVGYFPGFY